MKIDNLCFGKLAPRLDNRTLKLAKYSVQLPEPPPVFDNLKSISTNLGVNDLLPLFPMDGNDRLGDCTIAGIAHATTVYNGLIGIQKVPTESNVVKFYYKITHCRDTGCNMLDVLKRWKSKGFEQEAPYMYGTVDLKNHLLVKQFIWLFGGVYLGFNVQKDAIADFNAGRIWTPGILTDDGHAVYAVAYDQDTVTILTWGGLIKGTWAWWDECVDEAYGILPPEAQNPAFAPGFDWATLQVDFQSISQ